MLRGRAHGALPVRLCRVLLRMHRAWADSTLLCRVRRLCVLLRPLLYGARARGLLRPRLHRTLLSGRAALCGSCLRRVRLCRTLRAGRIPLVAEQLIKVLKVIRHGSVSLSTWNSSLRPHGGGTPMPLGA